GAPPLEAPALAEPLRQHDVVAVGGLDRAERREGRAGSRGRGQGRQRRLEGGPGTRRARALQDPAAVRAEAGTPLPMGVPPLSPARPAAHARPPCASSASSRSRKKPTS